MRYLCRLVTPPGGLVFDGFMGSGSTGKAAILEGFRFCGMDSDAEHGYFEIAKARICHAIQSAPLFCPLCPDCPDCPEKNWGFEANCD